MHCYMSIIIVRGSQKPLKGQIVHYPADVVENGGDVLPFPKCYELKSVIQMKPGSDESELHILTALEYLIKHQAGYENKKILT